MLKLVDLACQRGRQILWSNINTSIEPGTLLFVGGANGSGKSSLLRIIAGLSTPIEGNVLWFEKSIQKFMRILDIFKSPCRVLSSQNIQLIN